MNINLDDLPHIVIYTEDGNAHVISVYQMQRVASGEIRLADLAFSAELERRIVTEWLEKVKEVEG